MKKETAWRLIASQLEWTDAELSQEFPALQLLINLKYDRYQGFQPATKFHIAFLNWLSQFDTLGRKRKAYAFVKERLVFVSQREMYHLVSLMMPALERIMRTRIAEALGIKFYETWFNSEATERLKISRRKTLFVGLSDGARIDVFRRYNEGTVSNEQVVPYSEISEDKWNDLKSELQKWLEKKGYTNEPAQFEAVCLVDDFSGSGSSLIRPDDEQKNVWKGKIPRFYKTNMERIGNQLKKNCTIFIHHHLASSQAQQTIDESLRKYKEEQSEFEYISSFSYVLPDHIVISDEIDDDELKDMLANCYDPGIEDNHKKAGIWYGYKQCGLPLVLDHNTPNNTVAILWAQSGIGTKKGHVMKPLFVRRERHSSDG
ncbi:phosphoribosyltransferase-like protein [Spartinivicinus poritis]|uniref:PRTase-CE domain-containing protein n=1 Tax=Spartinivicinus poritis TaxID=2994640 RepID=A0ABT5UEH0_9GAMM|nr:hypothetical protein [Spartinivicinus sp. A2-2]MDE1464771.1 hypothetical protein [Spartinivicinus sp. A2-2]